MSGYRLRAAVKADFDFLYHLVEVCMKVYVEEIWGWDDEFQQAYFAEHFDISGCWIVLVDGRQAGQITTIAQEKGIFISAVYLLPEFQNLGLGSALIREVLEEAGQDGRHVTLRVLKTNQPAYRLYQRLGFVETAEKLTHRFMKWQPANTAQ